MQTTYRHIILLCKRLALMLVLYTLCRILFLAFNYESFSTTSLLSAFVGGIRFDLSAIALLNAPLVLFSLLPIPWLGTKNYQRFLLWIMLIVNLPGIIFNLVDIEYFKFTAKRTTADFFDLMMLGDDMLTLLPSYLKDFWHLLLILVLLIVACLKIIKSFDYSSIVPSRTHYGWQTIALALMVGLSVLGIRGGLQLRPIDNLNALSYGRVQDIPLIINSPFSIIRSWNKNFLARKSYLSDEELEAEYSPYHKAPTSGHLNKKNVVILIMESFGKEYVGKQSPEGFLYTPFFDSIAQVGQSFEESFANGRTSITALPSILSGIPALMDQPYVVSPYSQTPSDALPYLLGKHGYDTHFYHGGKTGTMSFDRYCKVAGIDTYHGMEDYPRSEDYDGNWGIYDRPYFSNTAEELSQLEAPYMAALFSLSSHHPYNIPAELREHYSTYKDELGRSIRYADDALRDFFRIMESNDKLDNTLFVLTADHIPQPKQGSYYESYLGMFSIPIVFYDPSGQFMSNCTVAQQTDILPTVIDYLGLPEPHVAWGKSLVTSQKNWSLQYVNQMYQLYEDGYILHFDGTSHVALSTREEQTKAIEGPPKSRMLQRLKAMIQQYNNRLIDGKLRSGE